MDNINFPLLFEIDTKDYDINGKAFVRHSARCITMKNEKIAMVHSLKYDYYKFPGGGIEINESLEEAMIRETREEVGLVVIPETVEKFGYVHRIQKSTHPTEEYFVQDNFYFKCEVEEQLVDTELVQYEKEEGFTLEWVDPQVAIDANRNKNHGPKDLLMIEREAKVLELLIKNK